VLCKNENIQSPHWPRHCPPLTLFTSLSSLGSADCCPPWGSPRGRDRLAAPLLRRASWGSATTLLRCPAARCPGVHWALQKSRGTGCADHSTWQPAGRRLLGSMYLRPQAPCFSSRAADPEPPLGARLASHPECCSTTVQGFLVSCPSCVACLGSTRSAGF
jgi:hypothetical protein